MFHIAVKTKITELFIHSFILQSYELFIDSFKASDAEDTI